MVRGLIFECHCSGSRSGVRRSQFEVQRILRECSTEPACRRLKL